jgi:hypothetical protein
VSGRFTYYYPPISSRGGSLELVNPDKCNSTFMQFFLKLLLTAGIIYRILCVCVTRYLNLNGAKTILMRLLINWYSTVFQLLLGAVGSESYKSFPYSSH